MFMEQIKKEKLSDKELEGKGVFSWPVWEKDVSEFDWVYDSKEECLFLEGVADIQTSLGVTHIEAGDFVTFPLGLKCTWDIKESVKKHYKFS